MGGVSMKGTMADVTYIYHSTSTDGQKCAKMGISDISGQGGAERRTDGGDFGGVSVAELHSGSTLTARHVRVTGTKEPVTNARLYVKLVETV